MWNGSGPWRPQATISAVKHASSMPWSPADPECSTRGVDRDAWGATSPRGSRCRRGRHRPDPDRRGRARSPRPDLARRGSRGTRPRIDGHRGLVRRGGVRRQRSDVPRSGYAQTGARPARRTSEPGRPHRDRVRIRTATTRSPSSSRTSPRWGSLPTCRSPPGICDRSPPIPTFSFRCCRPARTRSRLSSHAFSRSADHEHDDLRGP